MKAMFAEVATTRTVGINNFSVCISKSQKAYLTAHYMYGVSNQKGTQTVHIWNTVLNSILNAQKNALSCIKDVLGS